MKTASYTELRNNLKSCLDCVINDNETLIVHRSGNESVVMVSLDEYNAIMETAYINSSPETVKRIKAGEKAIREGKGKKVKVADLWK